MCTVLIVGHFSEATYVQCLRHLLVATLTLQLLSYTRVIKLEAYCLLQKNNTTIPGVGIKLSAYINAFR